MQEQHMQNAVQKSPHHTAFPPPVIDSDLQKISGLAIRTPNILLAAPKARLAHSPSPSSQNRPNSPLRLYERDLGRMHLVRLRGAIV